MKKILILIILTTTINTKTYALQGNLVTCWQHDDFAGGAFSKSSDPETLRTLCFTLHKDDPQAISRAAEKNHDINSPECWRGKKEDLGGAEGGM